MLSRKVIEIVEKILLPILNNKNLELIDIEYKKDGNNWFLRVSIDKEPGGIDIEDCEEVSEELSKKLDEVDPIPNPYFLEVASPGAERPLKNEKDIKKSIGKNVHISTYTPIGGKKVFEGKLVKFEDNILTIEESKKLIEIPYQQAANIRLAIVF